MANTGKRHRLKDLDERIELVRTLNSMSVKELKTTLLSPVHVSIATGRETSTLEADRAKRRKALKANPPTPIPGNSPLSLEFIEPAEGYREVQYRAYDLLGYLNRLSESAIPKINQPKSAIAATQMRGFQSWLSTAMPMDDWPFVIQEDGRPISFAQALITGTLTENCKRLTLSEFTYELMHASNKAFSKFEQAEIERTAKKPVRKASAGKRAPL
ncbi:hypothetical protein [Rhodoferax aquaticus]|uniref:Uncharacterized protein n=1 Tax=Rhodoferax aquaticus TaxID=2527691 RepID=A0A515EQW3_9BURK|nr:hypothetical protein [Rhodoferax aquaticus]QDL55005.1 hypothetical protein EXZ61_12985 [Rhodoferax aquaticus]